VGADVFTGKSVVEVCGHHLHSQPVPPSERGRGAVASDLEALLLSCLSKKPDDRPDSASELRRRLRACEDFGAWSEDAAREWWARHGDALAEHRRGSARSASGQSLVIDFGNREDGRAPWDSASITGTAPGHSPVAKAEDTARGDRR
jgi:serine/threonine-protein kinase